MKKRVLLTGIGGFIGAHCLQYWLENTDWDIVGIDSYRNKGQVSRIQEVRLTDAIDSFDRVKIYVHDLAVPIDKQLENLLLERSINDRGQIEERPFDYIINMASDSAVERSTTDPTHCLRNNYELAITMLEFARKNPPKLFIQISTDEVFGEAPPLPNPGHKEWSTIRPSNPYAASKAAQEAMAIAYWRTYDLPIVITNTMNIVAEWQDPEKFLPKIISLVAQGKEIPIYADKFGTVQSIGDVKYWMVEDEKTPIDAECLRVDKTELSPNMHCEGNEYWTIGSRVYLDARNKADALKFITTLKPAKYSEGATEPDKYNICGDDELNNLELAQMVAEVMGKKLNYRFVPSDSARPGYDRRYALDGAKLTAAGWTPPIALKDTLRRVVEWTMQNQHWLVS